jgi:hypothetical protein
MLTELGKRPWERILYLGWQSIQFPFSRLGDPELLLPSGKRGIGHMSVPSSSPGWRFSTSVKVEPLSVFSRRSSSPTFSDERKSSKAERRKPSPTLALGLQALEQGNRGLVGRDVGYWVNSAHQSFINA